MWKCRGESNSGRWNSQCRSPEVERARRPVWPSRLRVGRVKKSGSERTGGTDCVGPYRPL